MAKDPTYSVPKLLLVMVLFWSVVAWFLPITQDEAYYALWGRHLDFGYFDHPPFVAVLTLAQHSGLLQWPKLFDQSLGSPLGNPWFMVRLGTIVVATIHFWVAFRLYKLWSGQSDQRSLWMALIVLGTNFLGLLHGVITTPDTLVLLFWTLALLSASKAFEKSPKYWLVAGFWVGCGLWSKYTMSLIGVVFLIPLLIEIVVSPISLSPTRSPINSYIHHRKPSLLTVWPYLGGFVCLLVFMPHLVWNAQNDWITFRFQLRHGFSLERPMVQNEPEKATSMLPSVRQPHGLDREYLLAKPFLKAQETESTKKWWHDPLEWLNAAFGYYSSQAILWGAWMVMAVVGILVRKKQVHAKALDARYAGLEPATKSMIHSSVWVPLIFFGALSPFSKVEANWSAMYVVGASFLWLPLVMPLGVTMSRSVERADRLKAWAAAGANMLLVSLVVLHSRSPFLPLRSDRVLRETYGYEALSQLMAAVTEPLFVESYQLVSMLKFYQPNLLVRQWPGITRDSEATRNSELFDWTQADIAKAGGFSLLLHQIPPPKIIPYQAVSISLLRDCKSPKLQVITDPGIDVSGGLSGPDWATKLCAQAIRTLYLVRYRL